MVYSQTFDATGGRTSSTVNAVTGTASNLAGSANGFGSGVSLAYDAATGGYTVTASGASAAFLPSMVSPTQSNASVTTYTKMAGNVQDRLILSNPGNANPTIKLSYVNYGVWERGTINGSAVDYAHQYFVYGVRQDANQPSTGYASYTTVVDGVWSNPDGLYTLSGTSSFTADFSAKTVATTLQLSGTNTTVSNGGTKFLGLFNGSGTIAALGGGFSGALTQSGTDQNGNRFSGSFAGAFFGPLGQEMGYTFSLTSPGGGTAAGAVVGKSN